MFISNVKQASYLNGNGRQNNKFSYIMAHEMMQLLHVHVCVYILLSLSRCWRVWLESPAPLVPRPATWPMLCWTELTVSCFRERQPKVERDTLTTLTT